MKNEYVLLVITILLLNNSCCKEESSAQLMSDIDMEATTRATYISETIIGEKKPYVGDGAYSYKLSLNGQKDPIRIRISAVGGGAKFRRSSSDKYDTELICSIPKGTTQYPFDVLWTKAESGVVLMVRPENSTIELNADLRDINVRMKPMIINGPTTFELGSTIKLWCNYPINKYTNIKWTYDKNLFSEIEQSASVEKQRFQIDLRSVQPFEESAIKVEVHDFFMHTIDVREYFLARSSNCVFRNIGPQIDGYKFVEQYRKYSYSIDDSKAHSFSWIGENVKIISGQGSSTIIAIPLAQGAAKVRVSYSYKDCIDVFTSEYVLNVSKTSMDLVGPDVICDSGIFTIKNFPSGASVDWTVGGGLYTSLNQTTPNVTLGKSIASSATSSFRATLKALVHVCDGVTADLSRSVLFNKSGVQKDNSMLNGGLSAYGGECTLFPVPEGASNFHWSVDNGWIVEMQGYDFVNFINEGEPFNGTVVVSVDYIDGCGNKSLIEKRFVVGE